MTATTTSVPPKAAMKSSIWQIGKAWEWLTRPTESVRQQERRRQARLLSSMLVIFIPLMIVASILVPQFANPTVTNTFQTAIFIYLALGAALVLGGAYALSRTRYYEWGALITVSVISLSTFAVIVSNPAPFVIQSMTVYLSMALLLASILLSLRGLLVVSALNILATLIFPLLDPQVTYGTIVPSIAFDIIMAVIIALSASIRQRDLSQIEEQSRNLSKAVEQAEIANKLKDQFLANMSHELRTPLNAIIGFTEVMLMGLAGELNPQIERAAQRIHFNSERLLKLIDDVLDIAKIEAGRVEILRRPFEPAELLESVEMSLRPQATKKALKLVTVLDPNLPKQLFGDAKRLEQILENLVTNAMKFTEQGSVTISLQRQSAEEWAIVVIDTGIGIPPHAQETIFEKFRQIDGTSRRAYGGTGLGLAIVRELALLMDGNVKVKTSLGSGSTFTVTLPLLVPEGTSNVWKTPN